MLSVCSAISTRTFCENGCTPKTWVAIAIVTTFFVLKMLAGQGIICEQGWQIIKTTTNGLCALGALTAALLVSKDWLPWFANSENHLKLARFLAGVVAFYFATAMLSGIFSLTGAVNPGILSIYDWTTISLSVLTGIVGIWVVMDPKCSSLPRVPRHQSTVAPYLLPTASSEGYLDKRK